MPPVPDYTTTFLVFRAAKIQQKKQTHNTHPLNQITMQVINNVAAANNTVLKIDKSFLDSIFNEDGTPKNPGQFDVTSASVSYDECPFMTPALEKMFANGESYNISGIKLTSTMPIDESHPDAMITESFFLPLCLNTIYDDFSQYPDEHTAKLYNKLQVLLFIYFEEKTFKVTQETINEKNYNLISLDSLPVSGEVHVPGIFFGIYIIPYTRTIEISNIINSL